YAELYTKELPFYAKDTVGLYRTKSAFSDCVHIFCSIDELPRELISSLQFIQEMGSLFQLDSSYFLCLPAKGKDKRKEDLLAQALERCGLTFQRRESTSLPAIEICASDALGRRWTTGVLVLRAHHKEKELVTLCVSALYSLER